MSEDVKVRELEPCPFCGSKPVVRRTVEQYEASGDGPAGEYDLRFHIQCDICGIEQSEEYESDAIAAWNRRAALSPSDELAKLREQLAEARAGGASPPTAIFGEGKLLVDTGAYYGKPAVFVRPAPSPGPVGEMAPEHIRAEGLNELLPGEWFMCFPTEQQASAVADALVGKSATAAESALSAMTAEREELNFMYSDGFDAVSEENARLHASTTALSARVREVLAPFAAQADTHNPQLPDEMWIDDYEHPKDGPWKSAAGIRIGHLRAARTLLSDMGGAE